MNIIINGLSVNYTLEGPASGPIITMSNSLASNLSMWEPQLPVLTSRYRVLRYDTRGHGGTAATAGRYTLDELTEDVRALLQALGIGNQIVRHLGAIAYALSPRVVSTLGPISSEAAPAMFSPAVLLPVVLASQGRLAHRRGAALSGVAVLACGGVNATATALAVLPTAPYLLTRQRWWRTGLTWWWGLAVVLATAWWVAPLLAPDLRDLPAATIVTAEFDGLNPQIDAYQARLVEAGVDVKRLDYAGTVHGFLTIYADLDHARTALLEIATHIRAATQRVED